MNECTTKIEKLAKKANSKFPDAKIGLSGITLGEDVDVNDKINQTNENVRKLCTEQGYSLIDCCNIGSPGLNNSKFHLNAKGTAYLAVNFIKFIRQAVVYQDRVRSTNLNYYNWGVYWHPWQLNLHEKGDYDRK